MSPNDCPLKRAKLQLQDDCYNCTGRRDATVFEGRQLAREARAREGRLPWKSAGEGSASGMR